MTITKRITIDLQQPGSRQIIKAKQGDANSRIVQIALYAGGVAWTPDGTDPTGVVQYRKPDGTGGAYDRLPGSTTKAVTISGNQLTVTLAPQVLTAAGLVYCQVQLLSGATILTTFCWLVDVEADVLSGAVSEDYYNVATLDGLSNRINDLSTQLASAQAAITKAQQAAQTAQSTATSAKTKADAALPRSGGAMTGDLDMGSHDIKLQDAALRADPYRYPEGDGHRVMVYNPLVDGPGELLVATPTDAESAANKQYVDDQLAVADAALPKSGGTMTGKLDMGGNDVDRIGMAIFGDGDSGFSFYSGGKGPAATGQMAKPRASFYGNYGDEPVELWNIEDPTTPVSAANKQYVDNLVGDVESLLAAI